MRPRRSRAVREQIAPRRRDFRRRADRFMIARVTRESSATWGISLIQIPFGARFPAELESPIRARQSSSRTPSTRAWLRRPAGRSSRPPRPRHRSSRSTYRRRRATNARPPCPSTPCHPKSDTRTRSAHWGHLLRIHALPRAGAATGAHWHRRLVAPTPSPSPRSSADAPSLFASRAARARALVRSRSA